MNDLQMSDRHQGIVLRASSEYKSSLTLLDEYQGKIEGIVYKKQATEKLFHGALLLYSAKANRSRSQYLLSDIQLINMPTYWTGEHFLFFHHVLELADYFLPWDAQATELFRLVHILYTDPETVGTKQAQKLFLYHFFKRLGIYPEENLTDTGTTIETWLRACINVHPQAASLQTMQFIKNLELEPELHEELA